MSTIREIAGKAKKQGGLVRSQWKTVTKPKRVWKDTAFVAAAAACGSICTYLIDQGMQAVITQIALHLWL